MDEHEWTRWWVPGKPEKWGYGNLRFDPATGAYLDLLDMGWDLHPEQLHANVLLGEDPDGNALTLAWPMALRNTHRMGGHPWSVTEVRGEVLLRGMHFDDAAHITLDRALIRLAGLREISLREWLKDEDNPREGTRPWVADGLAVQNVEVGDGAIMFRRGALRDEGHFSESQEIDVEALITPPPGTTLATLEEQWLIPLEALTMFAARGPTSRKKLKLGIPTPGGGQTEVEVLTQAHALDAKTEHAYDRMLVPFAAIYDTSHDFIRAWWKLWDDLGPAAEYTIAALSEDMLQESKAIMRMSFLESYHRQLHNEPVVEQAEHEGNIEKMLKPAISDKDKRRHYRQALAYANEQTAKERARWMVKRAADTLPDVPKLDDDLADKLVDTRNALVHLSPSGPNPAENPARIYALARLLLVIQTNLLLDLGIPADIAGGLIRMSYDREVPLITIDE
jgi:hypothetical protein